MFWLGKKLIFVSISLVMWRPKKTLKIIKRWGNKESSNSLNLASIHLMSFGESSVIVQFFRFTPVSTVPTSARVSALCPWILLKPSNYSYNAVWFSFVKVWYSPVITVREQKGRDQRISTQWSCRGNYMILKKTSEVPSLTKVKYTIISQLND